ncbi:NUDIX hydrolase [Microbispora sp. RL4-1S]|uniref:NUDIX hydrolase n=1 Tax=Microbispora oryzae TaxID=2806554 RepID=A0A940WV19_9ACTN|nr:NUDIX hydrolase [Microbispora oryzae]MBP2707454.1 NUDIX hydrolase [Microbispora oryzae]
MIPADAFYAGLPKVVAAAAAFITELSGRVLLVKPTYRDHWGWPGGHVDEGEAPEEACRREVLEELALRPDVGRLLVVQWVPPLDDRPVPLVNFLFDCGTVTDGSGVALQAEELEGFGFFTADEAASLMPPHLVVRLVTAQQARAARTTRYLGPPA